MGREATAPLNIIIGIRYLSGARRLPPETFLVLLLVSFLLLIVRCLHRYIQKFAQMKTQLQAISLRIQTVRSNDMMMQSMKGATTLLSSMNKSMNLPALQRIAMEFEKENDIMDQREELMGEAIDDVTGLDEEEETDEVVAQVLDEIGVDLSQAMGETPTALGALKTANSEQQVAQAIGGGGDDDLEARLRRL